MSFILNILWLAILHILFFCLGNKQDMQDRKRQDIKDLLIIKSF